MFDSIIRSGLKYQANFLEIPLFSPHFRNFIDNQGKLNRSRRKKGIDANRCKFLYEPAWMMGRGKKTGYGYDERVREIQLEREI